MKEKVINFLNSIGIETILKQQTKYKGFLSDILIQDGILYINENTTISDLLHEAGHLAVLHPKYRKLASGNISKVVCKMMNEIPFNQTEFNKYMYCEDLSATAWAYAVGKYLNLPDDVIITAKNYDNAGKDILECLRCGSYFGITELMHAGFCVCKPRHNLSRLIPLPVYPTLSKWLQD